MAATVKYLTTLCVAFTATVFGAACDRQEEAPAASAQTSTAQPANEPVTVTGCLKAGEAADTFVLTASRTAQGEQTATYNLLNAPRGVDLASHVGRQVEVTGTVQARQDVQTRSSTDPAPQAKATSGKTPTVSTSTELAMKDLAVQQVRPVAGECQM